LRVSHVFAELGHRTVGPEDFLEVQAEHFAALCRMEAATRELPAFLEMTGNIEKKWTRYLYLWLMVCFRCCLSFQLYFHAPDGGSGL
jgi:hypothetical protein